MAQIAKIVKVDLSYIPGDPNAFPENLRYPTGEDGPESTAPILAFEGYNFLPTEYGYRSYFGEAVLNLAVLGSRCSELFMFQSPDYANLLVALCEDGIWTSDPATAGGAWTHVYITAYNVSVYERWTYTLLNGNLYCYQEANSEVNILTASTMVWSVGTPSFLTMAGQKGIFRAGGRLGFWDSANSISWSSALDYMDVTPSLETGAGNTKFRDVVGNIVTIMQHGDGFVIYSTKSIVGVHLTTSINSLWAASVVNSVSGIAYPTHVCQGASDTQHFVYTTTGLAMVGSYSAADNNHQYAPILTGTSDFLRESKLPMRLSCFEGRYLFLSLISDAYIDGVISSTSVNIPGTALSLIGWDGVSVLPELTANQAASFITSLVAPMSFSLGYGSFYGGGWDGTYRAEIDYNNPSSIGLLQDPANSTQRWGALAEYAPLKLKASPLSFLNSSELTVEGALNTLSKDLGDFITAQAAYVDSIVNPAEEPVAVVATGTTTSSLYPALPANPAPVETSLGYLIRGTGKDKLVRENAETMLNTLTYRRYFTEADEIKEVETVEYLGYDESIQISAGIGDISKAASSYANANRSKTPPRTFRYIKSYDNLDSRMLRHPWELPRSLGYYIASGESLPLQIVDASLAVTSEISITPGVLEAGMQFTNIVPFTDGWILTATYWLTATPSTNRARVYMIGFDGVVQEYSSDTISALQVAGAQYKADTQELLISLTSWQDYYVKTDLSASTVVAHPPYNYGVLIIKASASQELVYPYAEQGTDNMHLVCAGRATVYLPYIGLSASKGIVFGSTIDIFGYLVDYSTEPATVSVTGIPAWGYTEPSSEVYSAGYPSLDAWALTAPALIESTTTTYTATPTTGEFGYSQLFLEATEFNKWQKDSYGNWSIIDTVAGGAAVPPVFDNLYPVGFSGTITYGAVTMQSPMYEATGYGFGGAPISSEDPYILYTPETITITFPDASYNLIAGTPAPLYPTYVGALVLDVQLKKWGKYKGAHQLLVDYAPQNTSQNGSVPYSNFGTETGALKADGSITLFHSNPTDSWIRYGKMGYYRLGYTNLHEVKAQFRINSTGVLRIDSSMDGRNIEQSLSYDTVFTGQNSVTAYADQSARWHTVTIFGQWDLSYLELRGTIASRR